MPNAKKFERQAVCVRPWLPRDIPRLLACHRATYPENPPEAYETLASYTLQLAAFPQGQLLAELDGIIVGYATSLIVTLDGDCPGPTYRQITVESTFGSWQRRKRPRRLPMMPRSGQGWQDRLPPAPDGAATWTRASASAPFDVILDRHKNRARVRASAVPGCSRSG